MAFFMPLIRGAIYSAIGFAIGGGIAQGITALTKEPATEPMVVLGVRLRRHRLAHGCWNVEVVGCRMVRQTY